MNRQEKIAWFNMAVFAVSVVAYLVMFIILSDHIPARESLVASFGAFGLCGLMAFGPKLFRQQRFIEDGRTVEETIAFEPDLDERDLDIQRRARFHGFVVAFNTYILAVVGYWAWCKLTDGPKTITIDINLLPFTGILGLLIVMVAQSLSIIAAYRADRREKTSHAGTYFAYGALMMVIIGMNTAVGIKAGLPIGLVIVMLTYGSILLGLDKMVRNPGQHFRGGSLSVLKFIDRLFFTLFMIVYIATGAAIISEWLDHGSVQFAAMMLFFFVFGTLILAGAIAGRIGALRKGHVDA